ncbi:MAG: YgiT-type zinc finger protein [Planctomycetes bacterium]|nr:YgiT-type zinc finger protein [Planctomycetota bacterium]
MKRERSDFCEFCEGKLRERVVQARFSYMGRTLYIDHVPARVCDRCGEQYYDGKVYERMVEIAKEPDRAKGTIAFPLADYDAAPPPAPAPSDSAARS